MNHETPTCETALQSRSAAFCAADATLRSFGIPDGLPALHAAGLRISRRVLGGSHSVAIYPPIDALTPVVPATVLNEICFGRDTSLYVHIPFCETCCTFCHYTVRHYPGKSRASQADNEAVTQYLHALGRELALWGERLARSGTALSSVYIGGGTPLILEEAALRDLISTIRACYDILPGAEICIEGSPLTITAPGGPEKLRFLREHGFTRLSFGVQSFDDEVLKYGGRGYRRDVPIRAAQIANDVFDNWNLDLIQGLYKGSPEETRGNLEAIETLRPAHLTWYHGRFADRPQRDWYQSESRHDDFEDEYATLLGRVLIWQGMATLGYHRCDGNRFVRARHYADPFKQIRTSASRDLLGVGVASYSHVGASPGRRDCHGYVFRNTTQLHAYAECLSAGALPIATGRVIDDGELLAMSYATGLRNGRVENAVLRAIATSMPQLSARYRDEADRLSALGILEPDAGPDGARGLRLTELGRLFEDETLALFFSPTVQRALTARPDPAVRPVHLIAARALPPRTASA
ncbi:coproporphyrinogen-III oxidase family protein [Paraburkholderia kururiensis]|uniref:coproporphyrinogen-III oxidase family protein n=1 Tax=Paraburkholderia kururiensis TaxID=984307 RepID=UPI0005A798B9|nr:radical SAM protein [Paraburkholderia kururiensis]